MHYLTETSPLALIFLSEGFNAFTIDKALAMPVEHLADGFIERFYASQGFRVHVWPNPATETVEKAKFDRRDTFGKLWEVKHDRQSHRTGNVFVETQALAHSESHYYLILAGRGFVVPTRALREAVRDMPKRAGGDFGKVTGALLPVSQLEQLAISVL